MPRPRPSRRPPRPPRRSNRASRSRPLRPRPEAGFFPKPPDKETEFVVGDDEPTEEKTEFDLGTFDSFLGGLK